VPQNSLLLAYFINIVGLSIDQLYYCVNENCYSPRRKSVTATICGHKIARGREYFYFKLRRIWPVVSTRAVSLTRCKSLTLSGDRYTIKHMLCPTQLGPCRLVCRSKCIQSLNQRRKPLINKPVAKQLLVEVLLPLLATPTATSMPVSATAQ